MKRRVNVEDRTHTKVSSNSLSALGTTTTTTGKVAMHPLHLISGSGESGSDSESESRRSLSRKYPRHPHVAAAPTAKDVFANPLRLAILVFVLGGLCFVSLYSTENQLHEYIFGSTADVKTVNNSTAISTTTTAGISAELVLLDTALDTLGCSRVNQTTEEIASCVERVAADNSKKKQAQRYHLEENEKLARKRASDSSEYGALVGLTASDHPQLAGMDSTLAANNEWVNTNSNSNKATGIAYPNIEIVGFPKTGTSHLYSILTNRPDTIHFHPSNKEFCSGTLFAEKSNEEIQKDLFRWHETVFRDNLERIANNNQLEEQQSLLSVNGCISVEDVVLRHAYLNHQNKNGTKANQKLVVLFRDPAEWMWAAWNFWTDPRYDTHENAPGMWTQPKRNYRSPELFHEMLLAGPENTKPFALRLILFRRLSVEGIRRLWNEFGRENVLLLKSEDMRPGVVDAKGGFLDQLSAFAGLDRSLYGEGIFENSNCNDSKGADSSCGSGASSGAYSIAGGRTMLPSTRKLVYLYFWEECKIWSREFGVHYPECVHILSEQQEEEHE